MSKTKLKQKTPGDERSPSGSGRPEIRVSFCHIAFRVGEAGAVWVTADDGAIFCISFAGGTRFW